MRWKRICGVLLVAAALTYGYKAMTNKWETVSTTFTKGDKPYGGGVFVIRGDQAISLKIADPVITFKPDQHPANWDTPVVPTEAWMSDARQVLNRNTVNFMRGPVSGPMVRLFTQPGQTAAWWYSHDWNTVYVSTGWMDYTLPNPPDGLSPQATKLWRSQDGGKNWTQLKWPAVADIDQLLFLDPMRGYAVGWGPHVWRTADGGESWHEIQTPPLAGRGRPRGTFDGINLGSDGVLRVAYYVNELPGVKASSVVYRLGWDQQQFEREVVLPGQTIVRLDSAPDGAGAYAIYALSHAGVPDDQNPGLVIPKELGLISAWTSGEPATLRQLRTFEPRFHLDSLTVGVRGVVMVYATDASGDGAPRDYTLYSIDAGKSWTQSDDGMMMGGYFDPDTSTLYSLFAYTLKKRKM
jgi:hypothetical protein